MSLPVALQPLAKYRQFITYIVRPSKTRQGKTDKFPCDWRTGAVSDAHNPDIWTDYDTAYACGDGKVGFVLTDNDPFWFLDMDDCLLPSGWSPLAQELCAALPGAAIEVSQSGRGLHLFGTGHIPKHATKCKATPGIELYHTGRFAALGGLEGSTGSAATDCSAGLAQVIERYFKRGDGSPEAPDMALTEGPCEGWNGPTDDDELIRRLCQSKSTAGVFGSKATADQLWNADVAALSAAYPDTEGGRPYDMSSADAALAQHLAFWTGKDGPRMFRIMVRSSLARDKWDRDDYLPRTIKKAVAKQKDVCKDAPKALVTQQSAEVGSYLNPDAQKIFFHGCCYVADINKVIMPGGHTYRQEQFDIMMGGIIFQMDNENAKVTTSAWEAFAKSRAHGFDKAHTSSFRPDKKTAETWIDGNDRHVNSFWPIETPKKRGNPRPFIEHIEKILPNKQDRAIILAYMAAVVQHPGVKFQWCPLIQGSRGNGKTLLSRCLVEAVGRKHCHTPAASEITDKFNDWIENKIFIAVEDIYVAQDKQEVLEILKPMITSDWQEVQGKGKDKVSRFICANFMLNSNHKDAIKTTRDNRGLAVFYCAQQSVDDLARDGMDGNYFPALYAWLRREGFAIVTDYLQNYPIPDALNPAKDCHRAPTTSSSDEAIRESHGNLEQEVLAAVLEDKVGFRFGWISSNYLDQLIKECGAGNRMSRNKRRDMLFEMGYELHPGLKNGQVNNVVLPDGNKPLLFVKKGHLSALLRGAQVAKAYSDDQLSVNPLRSVA